MLVPLKDLAPDVIIDLRYASGNNITKRILYSEDFEVQLESLTAKALSSAAAHFAVDGYKLVVWDAYRPNEVQQILLEAAPASKNQYVLEDSNHSKGLAVDVTLVDATGTYLDMGTDHDEFSERAHIGAAGLTPEQQQNRNTLSKGMKQAGFTQWPYEWWHFDFAEPI